MKSCFRQLVGTAVVALLCITVACSEQATSAPGNAGTASSFAYAEESANSDLPVVAVSLAEADPAPGKIRVTGVGIPPANAPSPTIRREMAERAALSDAERKLVQRVGELKVGRQNLRSKLGEKRFSRKVQGYIKGYRIAGERQLADGTIEIDLELPLNGPNGLSPRPFE